MSKHPTEYMKNVQKYIFRIGVCVCSFFHSLLFSSQPMLSFAGQWIEEKWIAFKRNTKSLHHVPCKRKWHIPQKAIAISGLRYWIGILIKSCYRFSSDTKFQRFELRSSSRRVKLQNESTSDTKKKITWKWKCTKYEIFSHDYMKIFSPRGQHTIAIAQRWILVNEYTEYILFDSRNINTIVQDKCIYKSFRWRLPCLWESKKEKKMNSIWMK